MTAAGRKEAASATRIATVNWRVVEHVFLRAGFEFARQKGMTLEGLQVVSPEGSHERAIITLVKP